VTVITGLEVLLSNKNTAFQPLKKRNMGMITNHTSVTKDLKYGVEELLRAGFSIKKVFGPEHGFRGNISAGDAVKHEMDERTKLPVYSLYGETKQPTEEMVAGLDALLFDMQDIGVRFYTYIYTMAYAMEAAAAYGLTFYVLDRPNPITGTKVEGNLSDKTFQSFVGRYPIPIRHGMTAGELARLFNEEFEIGCELEVVKMEGWQRHFWFDETGLPWVMPSPNTTGIEMAMLYPGTCLFEGTNVSEGRGTTRPFEIIGAPWIDGYHWAEHLNELRLPGVIFRPTFFTPATSKYQDTPCQGVQVHIIERSNLTPIKIGLYMLESLHQLYPEHFQWRTPENGPYFIDLLMGTNELRNCIDQGKSSLKWLDHAQQAANSFEQLRERYLVY
jgi:uncharacterized protein YbbC (DUF1343 family)